MLNYLYNLANGKYRGFLPGLVKFFLFILSLLYYLIIKALALFFRIRPYRLNCKVISVGNIVLGGTGKTSLVEYIAEYLKRQGKKVAILSRGYKRKVRSFDPQGPNYETMGDEPYMLLRRLNNIPVIVDADRIRGAHRAVEDYKIDTVILDDGFQQWRLKKDLDIVTIDATNPFGNRRLIPRGMLREPLSSLRRAGIIVLTKTNINPDIEDIKYFLNQINPSAQIFESMHVQKSFYKISSPGELISADRLRKEAVVLFSGIADPDSFENLIISLGINICQHFRYHDHYSYSKEDLGKIIECSRNKNIDTIITTEKDAARLKSITLDIHNLQFLVLSIELKISKDEEEFHSRLLSLYSV